MVADQRTLVILERVEVSGQSTVVDRENKPAVEGFGKLASPVLHGQVHLASIPFGKGRGHVKLCPLRRRSGGERGAVKLVSGGKGCALRRRSRASGTGRYSLRSPLCRRSRGERLR